MRYARALLLLTQESGRGSQVCAQVRSLLATPDTIPSPLEPDLEKLIVLLSNNGRTEYLKYILRSYITLYCKSVGLVTAHLTTAVPAPELSEKLKALVAEKTGCEMELETTIDPDIVGGFIFDVQDLRLDASVRSRIEKVRRQFIEKNTRLV